MTIKRRTSAIDWLLEEDNPSVRYFTLTDLLGRSKRDHEVQEAKAKIML